VVVVEEIAGNNLPSGEVTKLHTEEEETIRGAVEAEVEVLTEEVRKTWAKDPTSLTSNPSLILSRNNLPLPTLSVATTGEVALIIHAATFRILSKEGEAAIAERILTQLMSIDLSQAIIAVLLTQKHPSLRLKRLLAISLSSLALILRKPLSRILF